MQMCYCKLTEASRILKPHLIIQICRYVKNQILLKILAQNQQLNS